MQVLADGTLRLRDDPVLAAMLHGLSARLIHRGAPFTPEPGAYAHAGRPRDERHHYPSDHVDER